MGYYDHPACTSYIKNITNSSKIVFLGHSMATTSSLIYASLRPKQASEDVKVFINLSPTALFNYTTSPFKHLTVSMPYFKVSINNLFQTVFKKINFIAVLVSTLSFSTQFL